MLLMGIFLALHAASDAIVAGDGRGAADERLGALPAAVHGGPHEERHLRRERLLQMVQQVDERRAHRDQHARGRFAGRKSAIACDMSNAVRWEET